MKKLSEEQISTIENAIAMYENDELIINFDDYEVYINYADRPDKQFPYKTIIAWYEGLIDSEDLIDFMKDIELVDD